MTFSRKSRNTNCSCVCRIFRDFYRVWDTFPSKTRLRQMCHFKHWFWFGKSLLTSLWKTWHLPKWDLEKYLTGSNWLSLHVNLNDVRAQLGEQDLVRSAFQCDLHRRAPPSSAPTAWARPRAGHLIRHAIVRSNKRNSTTHQPELVCSSAEIL